MRQLISLILIIFTYSCSSATSYNSLNIVLPLSIDVQIHEAYKTGKAILLFSYSDKDTETEAYADWASYLNDFKSRVKGDFITSRINSKTLNEIAPQLPKTTDFSLFIKQGYPTYFYEDYIVEPQVYTSVEHSYQGKTLTAEDKAFLPIEVNEN